MPPVDNIAQTMQVLRRQMAENLERMRASGKPGSTPALAPKPGSAPIARTLRQAVERRIKSIDRADPRYLEKAAFVFVESVLLDEFGEGLINDPEFQDLAQRVQSALLADEGLEGDLGRLVADIGKS